LLRFFTPALPGKYLGNLGSGKHVTGVGPEAQPV
jgi:hypothetical protein